jgi:multicomponent Na+:H+ antiporter subunit E
MRQRSIAAVLSTALALLAIWIFLTLSLRPDELLLGLGICLIIAVATGGAFTGNALRLLKPLKLLRMIEYVFYFLGKMFMANLDVLFRVIKPTVPTNPGIVKAGLSLRNRRAMNIVANSITLTPGTLTVEMTEDSIYVHWISLPNGDAGVVTQRMVDGFAGRLERIFE